MVGLGLVLQKSNGNCKENTWLWEFVHYIEGHAIVHKYNLNLKKTCYPKINEMSNP
jgi:hypothetical protein